MSPSTQYEEEWLNIVDMDMSQSVNVALSDIQIRTASHFKFITSRAITTSPVLDADIAYGGFPKSIKSIAIRIDTQSLYCSMGEDAGKPLKPKASIF
jgi:hypothetical protein